jgi:hypothetical protein
MARPEKMKIPKAYEQIWRSGTFLTNWSEALVIPILKPGRDPKRTDSYKSISLTSCLCKLMEKMMNKRLVHVLEEKKLLPKQQFGFRKNRYTIDVLNTLNTHITVVLSVTLFFVAMAKICDKIEEPTKILGYADDCVSEPMDTQNG